MVIRGSPHWSRSLLVLGRKWEEGGRSEVCPEGNLDWPRVSVLRGDNGSLPGWRTTGLVSPLPTPPTSPGFPTRLEVSEVSLSLVCPRQGPGSSSARPPPSFCYCLYVKFQFILLFGLPCFLFSHWPPGTTSVAFPQTHGWKLLHGIPVSDTWEPVPLGTFHLPLDEVFEFRTTLAFH